MYTYPNGLTCDASSMRIKIYEYTVPPLMTLVVIIGLPVIIAYMKLPKSDFVTFQQALFSLEKIMALWVVWMVACGFIALLIFQLWCRPVDMEQSRSQTLAKRQADEASDGSGTCPCCGGRFVNRT